MRNSNQNQLQTNEIFLLNINQTNCITSETKSYNYLIIIFTYELIQKLNKYYLIDLKQILLHILDYHNNINKIPETIKQFQNLLGQEIQIKDLFQKEKNLNNNLFQEETQESQDIEKLKHLSLQEGNKILNQDQKNMLQQLKEVYSFDQQIKVNLPLNLDLENYNKFILLMLQQFQYPQSFKLSEHNRKQCEHLVLQLIKILTLCSETHVFVFALEILIDIQLQNQYNKLMLDDKIVELIQNLQNCINVNIEYFKDNINTKNLDKINQKLVAQGIKLWQELYVKNKIKSNLFKEEVKQLAEKFNNNFMDDIDNFLKQFQPLKFNYSDQFKRQQNNFINNTLNIDELIKLKQDMIIELKLQNVQKDKFKLDLMCKNLGTQQNQQANNLNQEIQKFITEDTQKILILYCQDGPSRITLAKQTEEFVWEYYKQKIPLIVFDPDKLRGSEIKDSITKQLSLSNYKIYEENTNKYSIIFLIIIQEDQNRQQIIESVKQMNLLIKSNTFPNSKIICLMKSEILQCDKYLNLLSHQDQPLTIQLQIGKVTIEQGLYAKLKIRIINFLRKQIVVFDFDMFERIWYFLKLIISFNEQQNNLLDDFQIELILEVLEYHFSIKLKSIEDFKSEILNLKSLKYYKDQINELNLQNYISKPFLLVMILELLPSMDGTYKLQDYLKKNFTYILYQEALIKKYNDAENLQNIEYYSKKAQDYFNQLDRQYQLEQQQQDKQNQNNDKIKNKFIRNVMNLKFRLYEIYLQFVQFKSSQTDNEIKNEVNKFFLEKAFQNAESNKIKVDNGEEQYLEMSIIEYNIDNGYQFIHSSIQDFYISKFILDFLINIESDTDLLKYKLQNGVQNNLDDFFIQNLKTFNEHNFSKQQYNGIFKFLSDEVRISFFDSKLIKLIKILIGQKDYTKAQSNAFYLYSKIFGIIKQDTFENIKLQDISLEGCSFYNVNFNNSIFLNVNITNCNFVYCSLENVKWENLIINNYRNFQQINPKLIILSSEWVIYYEEKDNNYKIFKEDIKGSKPTNVKLQLKAYSIAISDNDQQLAIGSNQTILLLNTQDLAEKGRVIKQQNKGDILQIAFIQNDEQLIYSNSNMVVLLQIYHNLKYNDKSQIYQPQRSGLIEYQKLGINNNIQ